MLFNLDRSCLTGPDGAAFALQPQSFDLLRRCPAILDEHRRAMIMFDAV
jgi:hypothetical protein